MNKTKIESKDNIVEFNRIERNIKRNLRESLQILAVIALVFVIVIGGVNPSEAFHMTRYYATMPKLQTATSMQISMDGETQTKIKDAVIIEETWNLVKSSYGRERILRDMPSEYDEGSLMELGFTNKYNQTTSLYVYSSSKNGSTMYYIEQPNYAVLSITDEQYNYIRNLIEK